MEDKECTNTGTGRRGENGGEGDAREEELWPCSTLRRSEESGPDGRERETKGKRSRPRSNRQR